MIFIPTIILVTVESKFSVRIDGCNDNNNCDPLAMSASSIWSTHWVGRRGALALFLCVIHDTSSEVPILYAML